MQSLSLNQMQLYRKYSKSHGLNTSNDTSVINLTNFVSLLLISYFCIYDFLFSDLLWDLISKILCDYFRQSIFRFKIQLQVYRLTWAWCICISCCVVKRSFPFGILSYTFIISFHYCFAFTNMELGLGWDLLLVTNAEKLHW